MINVIVLIDTSLQSKKGSYMLRSTKVNHAPILLNMPAEQLWVDRQFQAALHLYLDRVSLWHREDIPKVQREHDKSEYLKNVTRLDPKFFSRVLIEWRPSQSFGLRAKGEWAGGGISAALKDDESFLYFFEWGTSIYWKRWLRETDCPPSGMWHLNSGPGVTEKALKTLRSDDPNTKIRTPQQLDRALYNCIPIAIRAVGTYEAPFTKPLMRCGVNSGDPGEVFNMHTNQWSPTGREMQWV